MLLILSLNLRWFRAANPNLFFQILHLCNGTSTQFRDIGRRACEVVSCELRVMCSLHPTICKRALLDRLVNVVITKALTT
jgi:hypothetical protein